MGFAVENGKRMASFLKHLTVILTIAESVDIRGREAICPFKIKEGRAFAHIGIMRFAREASAPRAELNSFFLLNEGAKSDILRVNRTKNGREGIFLKRVFNRPDDVGIKAMGEVFLKISVVAEKI